MRSVGLAACLLLSSALTVISFAQEVQDSPAQPKKLSIPVPVEASTSTLPVQVPDYLNESAGWKLADEGTGSIPATSASKSGLWSVRGLFKGRLRVYTNATLGLQVNVLAVQTAKDTYSDFSLDYSFTNDETRTQFALRVKDKWCLAKKVLTDEDKPTLENNVVLYADKLDYKNRTVVLRAQLETAEGLKEISFEFE